VLGRRGDRMRSDSGDYNRIGNQSGTQSGVGNSQSWDSDPIDTKRTTQKASIGEGLWPGGMCWTWSGGRHGNCTVQGSKPQRDHMGPKQGGGAAQQEEITRPDMTPITVVRRACSWRRRGDRKLL